MVHVFPNFPVKTKTSKLPPKRHLDGIGEGGRMARRSSHDVPPLPPSQADDSLGSTFPASLSWCAQYRKGIEPVAPIVRMHLIRRKFDREA